MLKEGCLYDYGRRTWLPAEDFMKKSGHHIVILVVCS